MSKDDKFLITPSRCTSSLPSELKGDRYVGEEKLDGSRYMLYLGYDPYDRHKGNTLLSRRPSSIDGKFVDRTFQVPHITAENYGLDGTVIDGEVFLKDFRTTSSIISSNPALAVQKQDDLGLLDYRVFDVPVFRGKDIRQRPLEERRRVLEEVVKRMENPNVVAIEQFFKDFEKWFLKFVNAGGEGIIIKDLELPYGCGWAKWKKSFDVSCIITGYKDGNGKYSGGIGSLTLSVIKDGKLLEVGYASGFDDTLRRKMEKNFKKKYIGKVIDVFAQELSKGNRLRHPTFWRFRDDINAKDCTLEKLKDDFKKKPKNNRWKYE